MTDECILIPVKTLRSFCVEAFQKAGMPEEDSVTAAEVLVDTDLRGVDSHGVILLPMYIRALREGRVNPRPAIKVLKESKLHALVDGDSGMGQVVSVRAMELCLNKAKENGMAVVVAKRSCHFGAARYYSMMALEHNFIGICATNTPPLLTLPGSNSALVGNNPFSFAFPAAHEFPIVFDMACSIVGRGKLLRALDSGQKIPLEWGLDEKGRPTNDPLVARQSGLQPPVGGYKGLGLALVMECLTGVLSGGLIGREIAFFPAARDSIALPPTGISHLFAAIDPKLFVGTDGYKDGLDNLINQLKTSIPTEGGQEIHLPGQRGYIEREKRLKQGVPLATGTIQRLQQVATELDLKTKLEAEKKE